MQGARATVGRDSQFNWSGVTRLHPEVFLLDADARFDGQEARLNQQTERSGIESCPLGMPAKRRRTRERRSGVYPCPNRSQRSTNDRNDGQSDEVVLVTGERAKGFARFNCVGHNFAQFTTRVSLTGWPVVVVVALSIRLRRCSRRSSRPRRSRRRRGKRFFR